MNESPHLQQVPVVNPAKAPRPSTASAATAEAAPEPGTVGFTLLNTTDSSAEFRIIQGSNQVARVGIAPGGSAKVPMGNAYTVQASTVMDHIELTTAPVSFKANAAHLLALMKMTQPGLYDFQLVQLGARQQQAIILENTWREPVTFTISRNGSPYQVVTVVDEHNTASVTTVQQWECYAIVNGITTETVQVKDPNAVISATQDNNDDGFTLTVS
ncbi:hypothetical protein JY651_12885 [Pyxidicoccus parkwayensis]|jgi:hypothetical protein|uniref:Uncharacterized protein n=1 Tax=Pyxidicoccus parkwayensis TaxID=2813578 RepID=A0ABX7P5V3_9BACT|nr:hypothetical protein [Pyxidicoccus parkwaysis]QSQ25767.1 hypothetical protein JY651_12885 [Pyxidicoccus parkwaysis]